MRAAFAVDPTGIAVDIVFFLPNRKTNFHLVDNEATGLKRFITVR